jgi:hypothetical protein
MQAWKLVSRRLRVYRQTPPPSSPASLSLHANDRLARRSPRRPSRTRPISQRGHTRTSTTDTTNARYAQRRSGGTRAVSGRAERVGLYSIWAASRNGQRTRDQPLPASRPLRTGKRLPRDNGAVPDAICQRMSFPRTSTAGAKRSWSPRHCQACRRSRAVRHAHDPESCQRAVPILVQSPAMLGLVRHAA